MQRIHDHLEYALMPRFSDKIIEQVNNGNLVWRQDPEVDDVYGLFDRDDQGNAPHIVVYLNQDPIDSEIDEPWLCGLIDEFAN